MNLIGHSIARPRAVIAAVLMVTMFGALALRSIPIQLTPDVARPVIIVATTWRGGSPAEVEREIVNRQEEAFKGIEGLAALDSAAQDGRARITLEFNVDMDMDKALLLVANRLDRVSGYPAEASEPELRTSGSEDNSIAWMVIRAQPGHERPIHTYGEFVEDVVQERLERVPGVGRVDVYGTSRRELRVEIDPFRLARFRLTVSEVLARLRSADASISAGEVEEGKRRYVVRTEGSVETVEDVRNVLLRTVRDPATGRVSRLTVGDVGEVRFAYQEPRARIRHLGAPSLAVSIKREIGANVIETMEGLRSAAAELRDGPVRDAGLTLRQVYDETVYIDSALDLVQQNVYVGGALAALVLLVFLRSWRATTTVVLAIPVSIVGSFVAMAALGRSINVISLAGLAFAVGMVVDAAIVVLENIYRLREDGVPAWQAALRGASEVWGAVLVSALTTVMVFIPILILELEVAQLFRDIAVAISVAVLLSLFVAVTVIPALGSRLLAGPGIGGAGLRLPGIDGAGRGLARAFVGYARLVARSRSAALLIVIVVCGAASLATWRYLPKLDYLPEGNRNLVFGMILPPPGYNLETTTEIARGVENAVRRHWTTTDRRAPGDARAAGRAPASGPDGKSALRTGDPARGVGATAAQPGNETARSGPAGDRTGRGSGGGEPHRPRPGAGPTPSRRPPPGIENFFFVATPSRTFVGATSAEPERAGELIPVISGPVFREPGTFGFVTQPSLFGRSVGGGKRIDLDIKGAELETLLEVARRTMGKVLEVLPRSEGTQVRPQPGLELGAPEVRIAPDRARLADSGVSVRELGETVDVFNDGLRVAQITAGGKRLDFVLAGPPNERTQQIENLPVVTSSGAILPVRSLADVKVTSGPTEILHRERVRTVTLEIRPPPSLTLEEAMDTVESEIIAPLVRAGLPDGVRMGLSGTADKLTATHEAMKWQLLLALVIVYLVMAILFESFIYPALIVLSVPLAMAGAVGGLAALNLYQPQALDMLTMLGFVILIGIVVNNAILLVHQALQHLRGEGMEPGEAIAAATRNRIRPIFMSTLTSVFGMLPLVLFPGAGSELYRGLGSVVVGGLALSALLTLAIIPPFCPSRSRCSKDRASRSRPGPPSRRAWTDSRREWTDSRRSNGRESGENRRSAPPRHQRSREGPGRANPSGRAAHARNTPQRKGNQAAMPRITDLVRSGRFIVTSELTPPKGLDLAPLLASARQLAGIVDAFNLTDSHNARMSMAPIAAARRLLDEGIEPIVQMTARDRNRIAVQSDVLAAAALGVANVVLMTGDVPSHGDHPEAKAVFDLGSVEIIAAVRGLNEGHDLAGNALRGAPDICIGAVVNPGNPDLDGEMTRLEAKVEAGARFFQTQAVYDIAAFERFARRLERFAGLELAFIAGIIPIRSVRMARYLNENVPGIEVPEPLIEEIAEATDVDATGTAISARTIAGLRPLCQGVHLMTLGRERLIPAIVEQSGISVDAPAPRPAVANAAN